MKAVGGKHVCLLLLAVVVTACACGHSGPASQSAASPVPRDEVRVLVANVGLDSVSGTNYVLLQDESESHELPILVGDSEARAIMMTMNGVKAERPLTHDLLRSVIEQTGNHVDRVVISDLREEVYYAKIYMNKGHYSIDSRPSDAIALAMNMNVPIYVNRKLFQTGPGADLAHRGDVPPTTHGLGLTVEQLTPELAAAFHASTERGGVLVCALDATAEKAGLARGDIITKVGDRNVTKLREFTQAVSAAAGGTIALTLNRDGSTRTVSVRNNDTGSAARAKP